MDNTTLSQVGINADIPDPFLPLWEIIVDFLQSLLQPGWYQNQLLVIVALFALAHLLRFTTESKVEEWARARDGWQKWQLRMLVQLRRRLFLIYFTFGAWIAYLILRLSTWPSRSYVIGLVATMLTVWLIIAFAARVVHNRFLRRLIIWGLWIYATLYYLNVIDEVSAFLDDIAIEQGGFRLSALMLITGLVIVVVLFTGARLASLVLTGSITRNEDISPSMQVLAVKGVQVMLYGIAFFFAIESLGLDFTGLAFLSGAIGVGLGFGLQKVVSNLVSGVIILLDKSIKPGDVISLGETFGWINALGARYVSVVTRDGREYLIPNEDLITGQVVNWSHSNQFVRLDIFFGTSYDCDPHQVRQLAVNAAKDVSRVLSHPNTPVCHIVGFGDSSVDYILRFWIGDPTAGLTNIRGNVYLALWDSFKEHGISIPFPQREVRMLKDTKDLPVD
jgi:small-conductance mechanosensitive channel